MIRLLSKYLLIIILILACSSGSSSPTDPGDNSGGGNTNSYEFPNAVDYGLSNQVEIVTWNVRLFPLMLELIRQYYRRLERFSNQYTSEELLHPDNFNVILQNIKSHHIERCSEDSNPFYYMHSQTSNSR